ncbi:response regulator transcription factor [Paenibacillus alkalitolerans]|uniref:response regulator transcription factor n=1 Tax=Paenibacillus alkalitolerans TaxID=2799335 RepID=UPI002D7F877E|nr:response regulator [Paenibacillus alkalitolerans]
MLLVDNEKIILDGISRIVDWEAHGTRLAGTARNGIEAFERIGRERPDIVISDIRMPGMDGLRLVEKTKEQYPNILFIMLSGFNEFEYAQKAMQFGVKHYLLKPCSAQAIGQALNEAVEERKRSENGARFVERIHAGLLKVLPHAKEQFLKELVTNKTYGKSDWETYRSLFNIPPDNEKVRLALFQPEGNFEYEHLFALTNIAEDILGKPPLLLSTTIGDRVLLLIGDRQEEKSLLGTIGQIRCTFRQFYKSDVTIALSGSGDITEARSMYGETLECLNYRFYLGEGGLITKRDIGALTRQSGELFQYDEEKLCLLIKSGRVEDVRKEIDDLFESLAGIRMDAELAKSYVMTLYLAMVRQCSPQRLNVLMNDIARLAGLDTIQSLKEFVMSAALGLASAVFEANRSKHSAIVGKVLGIIRDNLGNPMLSLQWVAEEMLYMNADYLGKLFKKETGEKFSNYVMKARMEKAIELIGQMDDVKVFELADTLGFGDNPKYFSYAFKKYTGFTPSEFIRTP